MKEPLLVVPPNSLLSDCAIGKPAEIVGKPLDEQRNALVQAWIEQTYNIKQCNIEKEALRSWKAGQEEAYGVRGK